MKERIKNNIEAIKKDLPKEVVLVAITKYHTIEETQAVVDAGVCTLGESRVQDLLDKIPQIRGAVHWHFIGTLQRNKVKYLIGEVELIHSVASMKLLETIEIEGAKKNQVTNVLIQFNLAKEETKSGFMAEEVSQIMDKIADMEHVNLQGVMCMGPMTQNTEDIRKIFKQMKEIYDIIKKNYKSGKNNIHCLSMGMSGDYAIAVEEGSSMVRIGSKIFE